MPRPKKETAARDDVTVKIDRTVYRLAGAVAAFRNQTLAEYLTGVLQPIVAKDFDNLSKEHRAESK